jgi:hypothetical protein
MAALTCSYALPACNNYGRLDTLENPGKSPSAPELGCGDNCRIFLTDVGYTGDLGGSQGADSICRNDSANPNGPGTGNWKAMVADESRRACLTANCTSTAENLNWVMRPNTPYRRPSGELIGITNPGGIFVFDLVTGISVISAIVLRGAIVRRFRIIGDHVAVV